jgi:hypothetical protein
MEKWLSRRYIEESRPRAARHPGASISILCGHIYITHTQREYRVGKVGGPCKSA